MIESYLLQKVLIDSLDKMSPEERESIARELGMNNTSFANSIAIALPIPLEAPVIRAVFPNNFPIIFFPLS